MSGAKHSKRLLKTSVAVAAAGTVAFAPLTPLAQAEAGAETVVVRIGSGGGFTRLEFAGPGGQRAQVRQRGDEVVVRLPPGGRPDVARLIVDPPPGLARAAVRNAAAGPEIVLSLAKGAEVRSGRADGAVYLNLWPEGSTPPARPDPGAAVPPSGAVPVAVEATALKASFRFDWLQPVGAAVFRRGEAVWVVFDTAARLDLSGAPADGDGFGPVEAVRWASGEDYLAVRIAAPSGLAVAATSEGASWTVTIGGQPRAAGGVSVGRDDSGPPVLVATVAGATRAIWLTDPLVGDRFAAVTALGPAKGYGAQRTLVDLSLLPTAQGLAVETGADDLSIAAQGDLVRLSRPKGLNLSSPAAGLGAGKSDSGPRKAALPALIDSDWAAVGAQGFGARHRGLQEAAAAEMAEAATNPRASIEGRLQLARFLVGSGLNYEAIGVLNALISAGPTLVGEAEVRGLRGAARAAVGRHGEAQADFSAASLSVDPSAKAWLGYIAAQQGDWVGARRAFAAGASAIDRFPPAWRARFGAAHARAALETGDLKAAKALLDYAFSQPAPAADHLAARLVQARMFEIEGRSGQALAVFKAVARAPLEGVAAPARLGVIRIEMATGALTPVQAAEQLEPLRWRWRGDATELSVIRTLGGIYLSQGRYREALEVLRGAGARLPDLPEAVELQADLDKAFRALFLEGAADGLQPVQALALFYDFRELTPVGADGDDMVRRLTRRLVDVDLLGPAAELLTHQVENRLDGVAQAGVATDLALIHLMNRQPEAALRALWASRTTLLPTAMTLERRRIEARALMELGRFDHGLEVLGADRGPEAQAVRADLLWLKQDYAAAAALYEGLLGDRWRDGATALAALEEGRLIRAGVGYSLARDTAAVERLSQRYAGFIQQTQAGSALRIALDAGGENEAATPGDFAALVSSAELFAGWVNAMKAGFRERTQSAAG